MALTSNIDWPPDLPLPEASGWAEVPFFDITRFVPEAGPAIVRRRSGRSGVTYTFSLVVNLEQYNTIMTFYKVETNGGVLSFNWTHPFTLVQKTVRFSQSRLRISSLGPLAMIINCKLEEISSE